MDALERMPGFQPAAWLLEWRACFHAGGTGYLDGVTADVMTRPDMWGIDVYGRLFIVIRTRFRASLAPKAPPVPAQRSAKEIEEIEEAWACREFESFVQSATHNHSICAVFRTGRGELGVVAIFERSSGTAVDWTVGSWGGHRHNRLGDMNPVTRYLGDDGGAEEASVFQLFASGRSELRRTEWWGRDILLEYELA